ncbi:peptide deformylase [Brachybacterium nesterenkovii]|uniref:peptide deformylase n=1 Tax=Brachybacterium nesterenkovii TaxID=47847 RepID=UPI00321981B3
MAVDPVVRLRASATGSAEHTPPRVILTDMDLSELVTKTLSRRREDGTLRIVQAGHPALRAQARAWTGQLAPQLLIELVEAMTLTMRRAPGVGLAAPQVGLPLALVVVEDPFAAGEGGEDAEDALLRRRPLPLRAFLNPAYEVTGTRRVYFWEGCLSVDGWQSIVPRGLEIDARALELARDGELREMAEHWEGWSARIFQHETDHLAGTLCHDRAVARSMVHAQYTARYADLTEAVRRLRLTGEVAELGAGEVEIG